MPLLRRNRQRIPLLVLLTPLFSLLVPIARTQTPSLPEDLIEQLETETTNFIAATKTPGVSVAVVEDGQPVWSKGFGAADMDEHRRATADTLFRLASVSKPLTATGAMQLWQAGKLDLDAPIQKYCPQFPQKPYPITTRELLGHLGGIRHYNSGNHDLELENTKHFDDPIAAGIRFFANDPLVEVPGTQFHYSTQGYTLVGCAIEGASGKSYVDYMTASVFAPAHMSHTMVDDNTKQIAERTRFYHKNKLGMVVAADPLDASYKIPGGGWLSSANDMAAYESAMLNDKLVSRATRDLMWSPQTLTTGARDEYGYGWGISTVSGVTFVSHSGGQQGTSTNITIAPAQKFGVVVLANMDDIDATALAKSLMKTLFAAKPVAATAVP
ncbi:MAG: serine hydrolase domain-containing protein [Candidatus Acidiferrales bacterium]